MDPWSDKIWVILRFFLSVEGKMNPSHASCVKCKVYKVHYLALTVANHSYLLSDRQLSQGYLLSHSFIFTTTPNTIIFCKDDNYQTEVILTEISSTSGASGVVTMPATKIIWNSSMTWMREHLETPSMGFYLCFAMNAITIVWVLFYENSLLSLWSPNGATT